MCVSGGGFARSAHAARGVSRRGVGDRAFVVSGNDTAASPSSTTIKICPRGLRPRSFGGDKRRSRGAFEPIHDPGGGGGGGRRRTDVYPSGGGTDVGLCARSQWRVHRRALRATGAVALRAPTHHIAEPAALGPATAPGDQVRRGETGTVETRGGGALAKRVSKCNGADLTLRPSQLGTAERTAMRAGMRPSSTSAMVLVWLRVMRTLPWI